MRADFINATPKKSSNEPPFTMKPVLPTAFSNQTIFRSKHPVRAFSASSFVYQIASLTPAFVPLIENRFRVRAGQLN
jgi:hypothetical protein